MCTNVPSPQAGIMSKTPVDFQETDSLRVLLSLSLSMKESLYTGQFKSLNVEHKHRGFNCKVGSYFPKHITENKIFSLHFFCFLCLCVSVFDLEDIARIFPFDKKKSGD